MRARRPPPSSAATILRHARPRRLPVVHAPPRCLPVLKAQPCRLPVLHARDLIVCRLPVLPSSSTDGQSVYLSEISARKLKIHCKLISKIDSNLQGLPCVLIKLTHGHGATYWNSVVMSPDCVCNCTPNLQVALLYTPLR
ncbi:hypothetical protein U9M48_036925 [Paspalum notatum var. saurae]|uniref:Uncharacterized protein n=1 Tax=Paspalum notatum var. saurae TaxID=547442 RepID=A0AAQ3XAJ5_PASNO